MADITTDLYNIQTAARGEVVRDSVVDAIKKINTDLSPTIPRVKFKPRGSSGLKFKDGKQLKTVAEI